MLNCSRNIKQRYFSTLEILSNINIDLKLLIHWLYANKISLNASKTDYVIFKRPRKHYNFPKIKIAGKNFIPASSKNILAFTLTNTPKWSKHVGTVANKLVRANGVAKLRHYLPKSTFVSV